MSRMSDDALLVARPLRTSPKLLAAPAMPSATRVSTVMETSSDVHRTVLAGRQPSLWRLFVAPRIRSRSRRAPRRDVIRTTPFPLVKL